MRPPMLHTRVWELCNNKAYFLTLNLSLPLSFAMQIRAYRGQAETNIRMKCVGSKTIFTTLYAWSFRMYVKIRIMHVNQR